MNRVIHRLGKFCFPCSDMGILRLSRQGLEVRVIHNALLDLGPILAETWVAVCSF